MLADEGTKLDGLTRLWDEAPSVRAQFLPGASPPKTVPKRVVTVAPSVTEFVFALGAGPTVVGVTRYDDFPEAVRSLPKVGGFLDPNPEAILALRPDLVVAVPNSGNRPLLARVARLGVPVLVVPGNTLSDVFHGLRSIAEALAKKKEGVRLERSIKSGLRAIQKRVTLAARPSVAFVYGWNPLILAGPKSFAGTLLDVVRARNIVQEGPPYPHYSVEGLIAQAPEVILDASDMETVDTPVSRPGWKHVPAVRNRRVHPIRFSGLLRPGPRIARGAKALARLLHPGLAAGEGVPPQRPGRQKAK